MINIAFVSDFFRLMTVTDYCVLNRCSFPPGFDLNRALGDLIKFNLTSNQWDSRSYGHSPVSNLSNLLSSTENKREGIQWILNVFFFLNSQKKDKYKRLTVFILRVCVHLECAEKPTTALDDRYFSVSDRANIKLLFPSILILSHTLKCFFLLTYILSLWNGAPILLSAGFPLLLFEEKLTMLNEMK